jgi:hyperosmotically inducible periplasmic protein
MNLIKRVFPFFVVAAMISFCSLVIAQEPSTREQMSSGATAGQPSDTTLARAVQSALAHDPLTNTAKIQVKTQDRMVTLSGTVPSKATAQRAAQIASGVNGVKGVENYIRYSNK